jgi:pimeloyl-ACP methyl ester carboxylesterase
LRWQIPLVGVRAPVALLSAGRDTVVPPRRTDPLRSSVRNLVLDRVIPEAGHNDLYQRAEFESAMRETLFLIEDSVQRVPQ